MVQGICSICGAEASLVDVEREGEVFVWVYECVNSHKTKRRARRRRPPQPHARTDEETKLSQLRRLNELLDRYGVGSDG